MTYYLAFDVGCIECGEESAVIGVYHTEAEAQAACDTAEEAQRAHWTGQHSFQVHPITLPATVSAEPESAAA